MVDEQTFVREVEAMERMLYRLSRSLLASREECGDAVQEALAKAWAARGRAQPEWFRPWLTRIVINECHNLNRRKRRVTPMAEIERAPAPSPEVPDERLRMALSALPERLRTPLLLHYLEGFSLAEIARTCRLPVGTVKSRLHQARERLRVEWEGLEDE